MERIRLLIEESYFSKEFMNNSFWFLIFGLFSIASKQMKSKSKWFFISGTIKLFMNITAGYGFYSLIVWIWEDASEPPLQIAVIMAVVYVGAPIMDLMSVKLLAFLEKLTIWEVVLKIFSK